MIKGAFGIKVVRGAARFEEGQQWLEGSADCFRQALALSDRLNSNFPLLNVTGARSMQSWPNSEGVIHIRYLANEKGWLIAHVFQPEFSRRRSVPLWCFQRIPADEFRAGMLLGPYIAAMNAIRLEIGARNEGAEPWFKASVPSAAQPASVADLRVAAALFERFRASRPAISVALGDDQMWRGLQVLMEGRARALGDLWAVFVLEPQASLPGKQGEVEPQFVMTMAQASESISADPIQFRGVKDHELVEVGKQHPADVMMDVWTRGKAAPQALLENLYEPPKRMLCARTVHASEIEEWAQAVWEWREPRARELLRELALMRARDGFTPLLGQKLSALLRASPSAKAGQQLEVRQLIETEILGHLKRAPL